MAYWIYDHPSVTCGEYVCVTRQVQSIKAYLVGRPDCLRVDPEDIIRGLDAILGRLPWATLWGLSSSKGRGQYPLDDHQYRQIDERLFAIMHLISTPPGPEHCTDILLGLFRVFDCLSNGFTWIAQIDRRAHSIVLQPGRVQRPEPIPE